MFVHTKTKTYPINIFKVVIANYFISSKYIFARLYINISEIMGLLHKKEIYLSLNEGFFFENKIIAKMT
jgi:hypothetical protein